MSLSLGEFTGRKTSVGATSTVGAPGTAIYGGYIVTEERSAELQGTTRYKTYSNLLANVSVVAAGVRYFLNLVAKSEWQVQASEEDKTGEYADKLKTILFKDPKTPWHRIVRRAAMYRFYGFSIAEWTAKRRDDGVITFRDIAPRPQKTIERWDVDEHGEVIGVEQRHPKTQISIYLPRNKVLYMVDDTLDDNPEGFGLFRHIVAPAKRLQRYEQLEGYGFESDLRGVPVGYGPFTKLAQMVKDGKITPAERLQAEKPLRTFVSNHIKSPALGALLDSEPYQTQDEKATPSSNKQWSLELLQSSSTSLPDLANAISRITRDIARILGVEQLLLGEGSAGSFALSKDKTQSFFLLVDATLKEIVETVQDDLVTVIWNLNGWPEEMKPTLGTEETNFNDVESITAALKDIATAGVPLDPRDPVIQELRDIMGLSRVPEELLSEWEEDAMLNSESSRVAAEASMKMNRDIVDGNDMKTDDGEEEESAL